MLLRKVQAPMIQLYKALFRTFEENKVDLQVHLVLFLFILLLFADTAFFNELKVCGDPALSKSTVTIFPAAFSLSMSLVTTWLMLAIFQTFIITVLFVSSVIGDL